jgi:hypothetical protein
MDVRSTTSAFGRGFGLVSTVVATTGLHKGSIRGFAGVEPFLHVTVLLKEKTREVD